MGPQEDIPPVEYGPLAFAVVRQKYYASGVFTYTVANGKKSLRGEWKWENNRVVNKYSDEREFRPAEELNELYREWVENLVMSHT